MIEPKIYTDGTMFMREQVGTCTLKDGTEVEVCRNALGLGIIVIIGKTTYVYSEADLMRDAIERYEGGAKQ
jgi:hypothetical protein